MNENLETVKWNCYQHSVLWVAGESFKWNHPPQPFYDLNIYAYILLWVCGIFLGLGTSDMTQYLFHCLRSCTAFLYILLSVKRTIWHVTNQPWKKNQADQCWCNRTLDESTFNWFILRLGQCMWWRDVPLKFIIQGLFPSNNTELPKCMKHYHT